MKTNRLMIIPIQRRDIVDLLLGIDVIIMKNGTTRKFCGFPDDMKLEQITYNASRDVLQLMVSSEAFEEVPDWGDIPYPILEEERFTTKQIKLVLDG